MTPAQHALLEYLADLIVADWAALAQKPYPVENIADAKPSDEGALRTQGPRLEVGNATHRS